MNSARINVTTFLLIGLAAGCGSADKDQGTNDSIFSRSTTEASIADANSLDIISPSSFQGISPGDKIATHESRLSKGEMVNGEGDFKVYFLMGEQGNKMGYLLPDPVDETRVGDIVITSSMPETTEGMKVGMTLGDLFDRYRNLEIHGSEIEGRTSAIKGRLSFRLDINTYSYEVDSEKIPLDTKITEITINRSPAK
ncbi:hypothetical protein [Persicitalea jodogahamensis]|uniref:Lipoprotein n=1 Tax=Persicitalea jodogahamensis TaxID=402147 RepID=A0A8J3D5A6_9BACT|nr:hypothetical protein [Persicitalea jodogahamensis]GHB77343.1 hypothetical protein GCM10007390_34270 [Persicitalea jodogahamensis]